MKKLFAMIFVMMFLFTGVSFAQVTGGQGTQAGATAGATAGVNYAPVYGASEVPVQMNPYPMVPGPMIQQNNAPTGRDKHWNRVIKPWTFKDCWKITDLNRMENAFAGPVVSEKGSIQVFPFEDMPGSVQAFTVLPLMKKEDALKLYTLVAAGSAYATDSETSYMQEWRKIMYTNFKVVGADYVMILHEGEKEGSEAFGWFFGLSLGGNLLNTGGNQGIGAGVGAGVSNSQTVAQEYPNLTILFFNAKKPATEEKK